MRLVNIAQRTVIVELEPEDCVLLGRACRAAYAEEGGAIGGPGPLLDALARAFDAAAMAAQTANGLEDHRDRPVTLDAVRAQLARDRRPSA